jgi:hypothetical protein
MNVADKLEKIAVRIDQDSLEPALKEMPRSSEPPVYPGRIAKAEILHRTGQGNFAALKSHVDVVCHETECTGSVLIAFKHFLEQKIEAAAVLIIEE